MARRRNKIDAAASNEATGEVAPAENANTEEPAERQSAPRPNVKLAAKAEPLGAGKLTVGMVAIGELPAAETQAAGWHCPFAGKLVQLFPDRFKLMVEKGK